MSEIDKELPIGYRLREYEILEVLGKGGMGAVYRARHLYLEEERAIKVIQSGLAGDKLFVERFIREARILTKLHHPNLVQLLEFGTLDDNVFFMVMELLRGESVLERIRRMGRIPILESVRIVREAALGLHSAHQKGIVHRDISPDNLLIVKNEDGNETTKVIDFGIAKPLFEGASRYTVANVFTGKMEYCSPEQCGLLEEDEVIDRRADIYSLGVTFYQMLAGSLPFYASTPQGYMLKHAGETPRPVAAHFVAGAFPTSVDRIVMRMLAKRRDERHPSMEDLILDLDRLDLENSPAPVAIEPSRTHETLVSGDLRTGDLFARRYLIEKKIGEGGMGVVYKAADTFLQAPVALKILNHAVAGNDVALERFKREVILARKVAHPNACRIYDFGEYRGSHYVSMEFLEGQTLAQILDAVGKLTPEVGLPILRQVLLALQEAHRAGVIHRDLKPQNIMVDPDQKAYIMDFGISIASNAGRLTQAGVLVGTPQYMAPEQFEDRTIDPRSDIYSAGVILYEILSGELPFNTSSAGGMALAHRITPPPRPSEIVPDLSPELESVILKAMEKDPANRYQSVGELLAALDPLIQSTTSELRMETAPDSVPHGRWRTALRLSTLAALLLTAYLLRGTLRTPAPAQPLPGAPAMMTVTINALPWANITIKPDSPGIRIPSFTEEETTTPCSLVLPAGTYRLELSNDGISAPLEKTIIVKQGTPNAFVFSFRNYDAARIAAGIASQP